MNERNRIRNSALRANCWLQLAERMLANNAPPAERALRYSLHFVNGQTASVALKPSDQFWSVAEELRTLHEGFYMLEMNFDEETDAAELTIVDYNKAMRNKEVKRVFIDLELDVIRAMHRNEHVVYEHKCELPYTYLYNVASLSDWLCDSKLPQWVVDSDAAIEHVHLLFV